MRKALITTGATLTALLSVLLYLGHDLADRHVRYYMGGDPAPVNCLSCHAYMQKGGLVQAVLEEQYLSPRDVAASPDGRRLVAVAEESDALLDVSIPEGRVVARIPVGRKPHAVVLSADGTTAYVTNSWDGTVSVVDLALRQEIATLKVGSGPTGLVIDPFGRFLYVANEGSDDLSVVELATGTETRRLPAGNNPYDVEAAPDWRQLYVANRLTNPIYYRESPRSEITVVDVKTHRVDERKMIPDAHLIESVTFVPEGDLALATVVRPKQLVPTSQNNRGWILTYGLAVIERTGEQRVIQLLLDEVNRYYADPYDVVVRSDGKYAFVTHAAANLVSVVDLDAVRALIADATADSIAVYGNHLGLSSRYVVARIPTGANPKRMALSPDGTRLYVADRLEDRITVIDTDRLEAVSTIDLGGPEKITMLRLGARQFHGARALQGQFSCRSCHPSGDQDALAWDFGGDGLAQNVVNTMTLRDIGQVSPFKWAGTNVSLYMQDGVRFAKHLTRVESFPPTELKAVVAYIYSIPPVPNRYRQLYPEMTPDQLRGKALFERTTTVDGRVIPDSLRCTTCHSGPYYTNRQKFDVGTRRETDKPGMLFDTPQLVNIYDTAPYLHDGSAPTLEEIWTVNSLNDEHGVFTDLNKNQLNDLIQYLRTLGPAED